MGWKRRHWPKHLAIIRRAVRTEGRYGSIATVSRCPRYVRFSSDSDQIADVPTRRIKCAPAARETACENQVHPCAEQRSRTSRTRAPVALTDPSEPWWPKPVHALQLQGLSWACDHRPWSCERVLYSLIAGCLRFSTLTQSGLRPPRQGRSTAWRPDPQA